MTDDRLREIEARLDELEEWQAVFYATIALLRWGISILVPVFVVVLAYYLGAR